MAVYWELCLQDGKGQAKKHRALTVMSGEVVCTDVHDMGFGDSGSQGLLSLVPWLWTRDFTFSSLSFLLCAKEQTE